MAKALLPLTKRLSAVNVSLRPSLAEDGEDKEKIVSTDAQPGVLVHQANKDHIADFLGKENTFQQSLDSLNAANLSPQASGYSQSLHCSLTTNHRNELRDPFSYEVVSPTVDLSTTLPSSPSPSLSPLSPVCEQVKPPDLPESNDDLWEKVMASGRPAAGSYAHTWSSMKSIDQLSMILATNTPMFKWRVKKGEITESDYKLHWLNSLKPEDISEKLRICKLTVRSLQQLCVPPLRSGIGADFKKLANLRDASWRLSALQNLLPFTSEEPSLFAQLGDNDLHLVELPSNPPLAEPPDLFYSMTAEIFPLQYREDLKLSLFEKKDYAAPYLSIFLTNRRYAELTERMQLWGIHMLDARVAEWCRACHPTRELTKKPLTRPPTKSPTTLPSKAQTAKSSTSLARSSGTGRPPKLDTKIPASSNFSTSANVQPEDERVKEAPNHYCVALKHAKYSIWKFEAELHKTSNGIERRGVKCTQFKENSLLLTDIQWEELASDLVGMHLDAANQTGVLVKGAVTMIRSPSTLFTDSLESVKGELFGNGPWWDQKHQDEAPKKDWISAFDEE